MKRWRSVMVAVVMVVAMAVFASTAMAVGPNLITNGNFDAGNTGFTSEYDYVDSSDVGAFTLGAPYVYTVGTNPGLYHSAWLPGFVDHTTGDLNNLMMIVNGTSSDVSAPNKVVWGQTVDVVPAGTAAAATSYDLYAGQDWLVGEVLVKNTATQICVKLILDPAIVAEHFTMTQVHIAVGSTVADIPHNKSGSPVPGMFPINITFDPGVTETQWYCLDKPAGTSVVVAAHAVVSRPEISHVVEREFCVTSGTDTALVAGGYAAIAWGNPNPWDAMMEENLNAGPADWIWDAQWVTPSVADNGGMVDFTQGFDIVGTPTSATLKIAADNAFAYSLNGGTEVSENLAADWRTQAALGNFDYPGVVIDPNPSGWSQVYSYNVLSSLVAGANVLDVTGVNADWDTTSPTVNPAAVIYQLCGTSDETVIDHEARTESAWGGTNPFPGNNWATYITYTPQSVTSGDYRLEFYAASSYPIAPAQLEVKINGVVVPPTLELTGTNGDWRKYSADWNSGTATSALIEIRDLRYTFTGDDFCIDDISFVSMP